MGGDLTSSSSFRPFRLRKVPSVSIIKKSIKNELFLCSHFNSTGIYFDFVQSFS